MAYSRSSVAIDWQLLFLSFLLSTSFMSKSCVYGARDTATLAKGHPSSLNAPQKSLHRSRNSIKEEIPTTDPYGESISLTLSTLDDGNFGATVGLGTPKRDFTLLFDTGSDLTWVRCQPCSANCDDQQQPPIFYPSISSTFTNASCESQTTCACTIKYKDGSYSDGYCANDTLSLTPSDVVPEFVFGCTQTVEGEFGGAAGVLGLGQGSLSLIYQTAIDYAQIFCYCLPATDSSVGYLLFGMKALETCQTGNFTPLLSDPTKPLYLVNLLGFTLGNQKFYLSSSSTSTIIDSGTVITRLPPSHYKELRSAFKESMGKYPVAPSLSPLLDTCYNLEGSYSNAKIPTMVLHFDNVDVTLEPSAVVWRENEDSQVCLAFAANDNESEMTIIGNHQQRSMNILYDIQEQKVEFGGSGSC